MSDTFRAYGRVEQLVRTSPRAAATAAKVMFERDARQRVDRLRDAAIDRI